MIKLWDLRYSKPEYAYGKEPNKYFEYAIKNLTPGKLLLPAEGEGRNAVYAAKKGWRVTALDFSVQARDKALKLARERKVKIDYIVSPIEKFVFPENEFDAAALIYAHFPPLQRVNIHNSVVNSLKSGGALVIEAFSKKQIKNSTGGPKELSLLYDLNDILNDFKSMIIEVAIETETELSEGEYHKGKADIIRLIARKP